MPSLDGLRFAATANPDGEVDATTIFEYSQQDDLIHARYAGGAIRLGFLVGTRDGEVLDFRYTQLNTAGDTVTGHCVTRIETLPDGRLRLHELWSWDSREGSGESTLEQLP
jgi:hypothetical protein